MSELDPAARQVLEAMAASGQPPLNEMTPTDARTALAAAVEMLSGEKPNVHMHKREWPSAGDHPLPLRVYRPARAGEDAKLPTLVYFHGGGWVVGDLETYDTYCSKLCAASDCQILSFEYRMGPEHKFPAAAEDACAAGPWAASHADELGVDVNRMAVGGDSAGGNLAAVAALAARDAGGPAFKHQLLLFPGTDMTATGGSLEKNAEGYFLTKVMMEWFIGHYLGSPEDAADWRASPQLAKSHADLPSATIVVAGFDPLYDNGVSYGETLKKAGSAVELIAYDGMIHDFTLMDGAIPEGAKAIARFGGCLRQALGE